jgi:putative nucleotidyltransferase with HDIG domain
MTISPTIRRIIVAQPIELPVFHPVAIRLQQVLDSSDYTVDDVIRIANEDQSLAGKVLKVANSPFYLGRVPVATIKDAVLRLGAQLVSNLAMVATQASLHSSPHPLVNSIMQRLWTHSLSCAIGCRFMAQSVGVSSLADQAYLAGLLHDVGKLYLLKALETLSESGLAQAQMEEGLLLELFDELHVEQGCRLMEHWRLPQQYCEVVAQHHAETAESDDMVLAIVRIVNLVCRKKGLSLHAAQQIDLLGLQESRKLGISASQFAELESVLDEAQQIDVEH